MESPTTFENAVALVHYHLDENSLVKALDHGIALLGRLRKRKLNIIDGF